MIYVMTLTPRDLGCLRAVIDLATCDLNLEGKTIAPFTVDDIEHLHEAYVKAVDSKRPC